MATEKISFNFEFKVGVKATYGSVGFNSSFEHTINYKSREERSKKVKQLYELDKETFISLRDDYLKLNGINMDGEVQANKALEGSVESSSDEFEDFG